MCYCRCEHRCWDDAAMVNLSCPNGACMRVLRSQQRARVHCTTPACYCDECDAVEVRVWDQYASVHRCTNTHTHTRPASRLLRTCVESATAASLAAAFTHCSVCACVSHSDTVHTRTVLHIALLSLHTAFSARLIAQCERATRV